jgi:hypothetical protein
MYIFYTNIGLLDHAVERCMLDKSFALLIVFVPKLTISISNDISLKGARLGDRVKLKLIVRKNIVIDSWYIYRSLKMSDGIYYDDLSGKDVLSLMLLFSKRKVLFLHDVKPHLGERRLFDAVKSLFYISFEKIYLCSNFSYKSFVKEHKILARKAELRSLPIYNYLAYGITVPSVGLPNRYLLIFGRVSPYKGISEFLTIYNLDLPIVVVGKGHPVLHHKVIHVNEFVPVSDLNFFISKSAAIIVPYLEATQSGVLSVLKGFENLRVFIRDIDAFRDEEILDSWTFYKDEEINDLLKSL